MSSECSLVSSLVQKCTLVTSLNHARQLHARLLTAMTVVPQAPSPFLYNNVLSMYSRCGCLTDAQTVFDKMPQRNVVSFNALISSYSRFRDEAVSALRLSAQMGFESLRPNGSTLTSLLQASSVLEDCSVGSVLHGQVVKLGFSDDPKVQTSLLGMYSNCGHIAESRKVFLWLVDKDVVAWNSIILGSLKNLDASRGLELFSDMLRTGVRPSQFTYSMVLKVCGESGYHQLGKFIHARIVISNTKPDSALLNSLLDMYCNNADAENAFAVFGRMETRDLVSWNSMISGCAGNGDSHGAMGLFVRLKGSPLKPDEYTFAAIVSATSRSAPYSGFGRSLHGEVIKSGFEESVFVGATIVSMYFNGADPDAAERAFLSVPEKDAVIWTEMIAGRPGHGSIGSFREMCREGHRVDAYSLSGALSACADVAALRRGEMMHSQAVKAGLDAEMSVRGTLVDMYAKSGAIGAALEAFSLARDPDLRCRNAMLGAFGHHGMFREAFEVFNGIVGRGLEPDRVTFLSLLSACNHGGLVQQGKGIWDRMRENGTGYGIKHYCCMVSLLSRAGFLEEAEEMAVKAPFGRSNAELWRTLLSSCVVRRNLVIGIRAAEEVLRLDPEDSGAHVLLSNLYAGSGKWDGVSETRRSVRGLGLEKDPGLSWFEAANGDVRVFSSGDSSSEVVEAEIALSRLVRNLKRSEICELDGFLG